MNPAHEFLIRVDLAKNLITIPCCLCLERNKEKIVITISKDPEGYRVQRWDIEKAKPFCALPPMDDNIELSLGRHLIPKGFHMLSFKFQSVYDDENDRRDPVSIEIYKQRCEELFGTGSQEHKIHKWLWKTFESIYFDFHEIPIFMPFEYAKKKRPKQWKYWQAWCKYILHTPGELIFISP